MIVTVIINRTTFVLPIGRVENVKKGDNINLEAICLTITALLLLAKRNVRHPYFGIYGICEAY